MTASLGASTSANSESASYTCNRPTVAAGDMLLAFQAKDIGGVASMTTPTGGETWQLLTSQAYASSAGGAKVWWKFANGSEPATYTFKQESGDGGTVIVVAVSETATTTPVTAQAVNESSSSTASTPGITPTSGEDLEFRFASGAGASVSGTMAWTMPSGYTNVIQVQSGTFTPSVLACKSLTSNASTGSLNISMSTSMPRSLGVTVAVPSLIFMPHRGLMVGQAVVRAAFI